MVLSCFPSLSGIHALTHKISFHRDLDFGHRQDTKQADHAIQKPLSGVNYPFYNTGIWARKVSFVLFPVLFIGLSPAKAANFDASKYCSKNHNAGS
jgi:hypothetical protein